MHTERHLASRLSIRENATLKERKAGNISNLREWRGTTIPATFAAMRESLRKNPDSEAGVTIRGKTVSTSQANLQTFNALFAKYRNLLYFVAHRVLRHHPGAEDAVQRCFLSARVNTPEFASERDFRSSLVRVLMDEAVMILHTKNLQAPSYPDVLLGSFGDSLDFSLPDGGAGHRTPGESWGWY